MPVRPVLFPHAVAGSGRSNTRILFEPWPVLGQGGVELILEAEFEPKMLRLLRAGLVRLPGRAPRIALLDGAFGFVPRCLRLDGLVSPSKREALHAITDISPTPLPPTPRIRPGCCKPEGAWTVADFAIEIGALRRLRDERSEAGDAPARPEISAS